ncbi:MAG TPA: guanylate kinase [Chthonomonadales bacterium]|nr:guanylate kinase [Chthonomonadales bacterium]
MDNAHADVTALISLLRAPRGRVIVISGPSGVGKGTVIEALLGAPDRPVRLRRCATATTRAARQGERPGYSRLFLSREEFLAGVRDGYFLEHVEYNGHLYGTPREPLERMLDSGEDVLLEIEVRGGIEVRRTLPEAVLVFLLPPTWEELERRLQGRRTDDQEQVRGRLRIAREELLAAPEYDYSVVNDQPSRAAAEIRSIVVAERARVRRLPE